MSEGVEFEIAGSPVEGLQLTGGLTAMRIVGEDGGAAGPSSHAARTLSCGPRRAGCT